LRAKEECHSFLSTGAMWEWPSYFEESDNMSGPLFPLFFLVKISPKIKLPKRNSKLFSQKKKSK
jgi:hypothetical protein